MMGPDSGERRVRLHNRRVASGRARTRRPSSRLGGSHERGVRARADPPYTRNPAPRDSLGPSPRHTDFDPAPKIRSGTRSLRRVGGETHARRRRAPPNESVAPLHLRGLGNRPSPTTRPVHLDVNRPHPEDDARLRRRFAILWSGFIRPRPGLPNRRAARRAPTASAPTGDRPPRTSPPVRGRSGRGSRSTRADGIPIRPASARIPKPPR